MFFPGTNDTDILDQSMRASLSDSIVYIHETVGHRLDIATGEVHAASVAVKSHRVVPSIFGHYYKLVLAVQRADYGQARSHFVHIIEIAGQTPAFSVATYTEASLGTDKHLFGELIDPNPGLSPWLCPPGSDNGFKQRVRDSLAMIALADPALAAELTGLIVQVVGAVPYDGPNARTFGSVSSFMLWGLVILNMARYASAADLVQALVHEAAHLLLFANSIDEPLVTNPIEERYMSPLRSDPRPMDGVFHATFVSARLHYVNRKLREATTATFQPVAMQELDERLMVIRDLYFGGLKTVQEHARLTGTGQRILGETLDYMQAV